MVIWTGYGFWAFILGAGFPILCLLGCNGFGLYDGFCLPFGFGLLLAGVCCWILGRNLHAPDGPDVFMPDASEPPHRTSPIESHTLYFIRVEYWGVVFGILGFILMASILTRGGDIQMVN